MRKNSNQIGIKEQCQQVNLEAKTWDWQRTELFTYIINSSQFSTLNITLEGTDLSLFEIDWRSKMKLYIVRTFKTNGSKIIKVSYLYVRWIKGIAGIQNSYRINYWENKLKVYSLYSEINLEVIFCAIHVIIFVNQNSHLIVNS